MSELLPCPFCGGEARIDKNMSGDSWMVLCPHEDCDVRSETAEWWHPKEAAVSRWNRRTPPAEVAALRAENDKLKVGVCRADIECDKLAEQNTTLRARVAALRAERDEWRGQHDAVASKLTVERTFSETLYPRVQMLEAVLRHAALQLEYMDARSPSGSTPAVLAQISAALNATPESGR